MKIISDDLYQDVRVDANIKLNEIFNVEKYSTISKLSYHVWNSVYFNNENIRHNIIRELSLVRLHIGTK